MLPVAIKDVDVPVLRSLIVNGVREGKTIEYKREMPGAADSDAVRFLATVSSFANTAGGDILLGVEANDGVAVELPGIEIDNLDRETLRIEHVLLNGLEPRLPQVDIQPVMVEGKRYVLVVRVARSWIAPHRIIRNSKFYARNSAGRYELDVGELRTAFTMSETIAARIRDFRTERITRILNRKTPVPIDSGGCMVVHVLPLGAFTGATTIDIAACEASTNRVRPMEVSGWYSRINLDGVVNFTGHDTRPSHAYAQIFRTGSVESACVLGAYDDRFFLAMGYESEVMKCLKDYLVFAREFSIEPPYYLFLSFVGVRGYTFAVDRNMRWREDVPTLQEDMVILPEVLIADRDVQPHKLLKPVFDIVWNAFGFVRSFNFDDQGNWIGR